MTDKDEPRCLGQVCFLCWRVSYFNFHACRVIVRTFTLEQWMALYYHLSAVAAVCDPDSRPCVHLVQQSRHDQ